MECAINGIGERAGNASLEEIVMLLHTRESTVGLWTGAVTQEIARTSRLVSRLTGYPVQPNKAIVGRNAFAHEAGIHQDGVLKERTTYEIMDATTIGLDSNSIVLGKHSGRHALRNALEELGFQVDGAALNTAFKRFKELADKKKTVTAVDLEAIVSDEMRQAPDLVRDGVLRRGGLERARAARPRERAPPRRRGRVGQLHRRRPGGRVLQRDQRRRGPRRPAARVPRERGHRRARRARRGHRDARARRQLASGVGVSTDILEASGKAYLRALSTALAKAGDDWSGSLHEAEHHLEAEDRHTGALSVTDFTWRDGERLIRFGRGAVEEAPSLIAGAGLSDYALLTTERAVDERARAGRGRRRGGARAVRARWTRSPRSCSGRWATATSWRSAAAA